MVCVADFQSELYSLITDSESKVVVVKGKWGVGKTYYWNSFLAKNKDDIFFDKYSYVSLFSISSLEQLKIAMFENTKLFKSPSYELGFWSGFRSAGSFKNKYIFFRRYFSTIVRPSFFRFFEFRQLKGFSSLAQMYALSKVKDMLICIDDLERRSSNLSMKDILGLVSYLRENKNCKIVILYNDDADSDDSSYLTYKEKVIDYELEFSPNPEDNISLIIKSTCKTSIILKKYLSFFEVNNIRIISKIYKNLLPFFELLSDEESHAIDMFIHRFVFFSLSYYKASQNVPDYNFIKSLSIGVYFITVLPKDPDTIEYKNYKLLIDNGISSLMELDSLVLNGLKAGVFDKSSLSDIFYSINNEASKYESRLIFEEAFNKFYHSFSDESSSIEFLITSMRSNFNNISISTLNSVVCSLKKIGFPDANKLVDDYFYICRSNISVNSCKNIFTDDGVIDDYISKKFDDIVCGLSANMTLKEVIDDIVVNSSEKSYEEYMIDISPEDFEEFLIQLKGENFNTYIRGLLRFYKSFLSAEDLKNTAFFKSLISISEKSPLNKFRLSRFDIDI